MAFHLPQLACESSMFVKENPDRKKSKENELWRNSRIGNESMKYYLNEGINGYLIFIEVMVDQIKLFMEKA